MNSHIWGDEAGGEPKGGGGRDHPDPTTVALELVSPGVPISQRSQFLCEISKMFNVGSIVEGIAFGPEVSGGDKPLSSSSLTSLDAQLLPHQA